MTLTKLNIAALTLLGVTLFGTAHALLPNPLLPPTLNPLMPVTNLLQPLQQPVAPQSLEETQAQTPPNTESVESLQTQPLQIHSDTQAPSEPQPTQTPLQTEAQTQLAQEQPQQVAPPTTFTPPLVQEQINTVLHAYVLEGDTLSPVTPESQIKSGDVIEYQAYISNNSKERVRSVNVSFDVPAGAELIGGFRPETPLASVDGTRFYPTPLRTNVNGQIETIAMSNYKSIRWSIQDLGIDGVAVVKFQMKVK